MDFFGVLFLALLSVLVGCIFTLSVQYYVFYVYLKKSPVAKAPQHHSTSDYDLPEALKKHLDGHEELGDKRKGSLPISLVLQFLFHELRHSEYVKRWLYKKLSMELDELLTKTTIGKFFESISIKDMHLGTQFPDIKEITIDNVKLDKKEGYIDVVSLCLNLDYTGNFLLSVEAKMKFGKTAYLSIKVKKISGAARLQFSRQPYTHWSFSFFNDPVLDLAVESHFQGRQLQSNITNLIVNQIKKVIKRKHTLPNYKIRYKPFFVKTDPSQLEGEDGEIIPQGQLDLSCVELSRLSIPEGVHSIYCTYSMDTIPWISLYQQDDLVFMITEITMVKLRQAQLGVIFKQDQGVVLVDSIVPHSSAYRAGLRPSDIVLAVENKPAGTVPQVAKLIKSVASSNITLRIKRIVRNYLFKPKIEEQEVLKPNLCCEHEQSTSSELCQTEQDSFIIVDNVKKSAKLLNKTPDKIPKMMPSNENMSKLAQTIGNFSLRKRKTSFSESTKNTPNSSGPSTPQHTVLKQNSLTSPKQTICELPEIKTESQQDMEDLTEVFRGRELPSSSMLAFKEDYSFNLKDNLKYLNINVWGQLSDDKELLLGYTNIPLSHILNECCNSFLGHYIRCYSFLPPNIGSPNHPLYAHSGFEHVFCYGDILLSFVWTHDGEVELKRKLSTSTENLQQQEEPSIRGTSTKHDFIRTQFHRTIQCDFCTKKIWLKDAVQCRQCNLCCHKKCIVKCQLSTGCTPCNESATPEAVLQPEVVLTEVADELLEQNLKRVNSANNLAIPGGQFVGSSSRSLPPSPQRTPSRKQSLAVINPFSACPGVLDAVMLQQKPEDGADNVNKLLEQIMLCPLDERLMELAKETGMQFYVNMPYEEKKDKINLMMAELKQALDNVTMEHMELSKKMGLEGSEVEKARLAFLMGQADAKVHGLSVLMLHYCSSLQHTQEKIV